MIKGCLKLCPPSSSAATAPRDNVQAPTRLRKSVSFGEQDSVQVHVHIADDWDRSPVDMSAKLSYFDILELKEMKMALMRSNPEAHAHNNPGILRRVPVGLLPLLPESPAASPLPTPSHTPLHTPSVTPTTTPPASPRSALAALPFIISAKMGRPTMAPPSPPTTPPRLSPSSTPPARTFAFLPLLETPPESGPPSPNPLADPHDTPVSLQQLLPLLPPDDDPSSDSLPIPYFTRQSKAANSNLPPNSSQETEYFPLQSINESSSTTSFTSTAAVSRMPHLCTAPVLKLPSSHTHFPPSPPLEGHGDGCGVDGGDAVSPAEQASTCQAAPPPEPPLAPFCITLKAKRIRAAS